MGGGKSALVSTVCACTNDSGNLSRTSPIMDKLHVVVMRRKAPVLAFPEFDRGFLLDTDPSEVGLGAVLTHKQNDGSVRPVAYASRTLQPHE